MTPQVKKSRLCWIRTFAGTVHVTTGYETYYLSKNGRIITSCPLGALGGLKPERLGQYNQGGAYRFSMVCREEDLDKCLGGFLRKFDKHQIKFYLRMPAESRPAINLVFDRATNDHPLYDMHRRKVAKLKEAKCTKTSK